MLACVLDLLAPSRCVVCGVRAPPPWCRACAARARALAVVGSCPRCGGPGTRIHACWRDEPPVAWMHVGYHYRGVVAETVVAAKLRGATAAWEPLGGLLAEGLRRRGVPEADGVSFVPTEPGRRRTRGLDHAARLAAGVAHGLGLPLVTALRSRRGLADQGRRAPHQRPRVPADAFRPRGAAPGRRLLLVDDVVTTGATLEVAARALARTGAQVGAVLLARAGRHPLGRLPSTPAS